MHAAAPMEAEERRRPLLQPGWIIVAMFPMFPVWWALGFGGFVYQGAAVVLLIWILGRRQIALPPSAAILSLYIGWVLLSATQLDKASRYLAFSYRFAAYLCALFVLIYVFNERRLTREWIVHKIGLFWIFCILGAYVSLAVPTFRFPVTLASLIFPQELQANEFLGAMIRPGVSQVQEYIGFSLSRPKIFFSFSNEWGGVVGLLTPFFVVGFLRSPRARRRRVGHVVAALAIVPIVLSANRGLWISLGLYVAYLAFRGVMSGDARSARPLLAVALVVLAVVVSPIGDLAESGASRKTDAREGIYREALDGAAERPILGWGGTRPSTNPESPSVGTHGQLFNIVFSHGYVGLVLYISWAMYALLLAARRSDGTSVHLSTVLVIGLVQMFFYDLLPEGIPLMAIALALCLRGRDVAGGPDQVGVRSGAPAQAETQAGSDAFTETPTEVER